MPSTRLPLRAGVGDVGNLTNCIYELDQKVWDFIAKRASMRITLNNMNYNSGGVYKYDFGVRGQTADGVAPDAVVLRGVDLRRRTWLLTISASSSPSG